MGFFDGFLGGRANKDGTSKKNNSKSESLLQTRGAYDFFMQAACIETSEPLKIFDEAPILVSAYLRSFKKVLAAGITINEGKDETAQKSFNQWLYDIGFERSVLQQYAYYKSMRYSNGVRQDSPKKLVLTRNGGQEKDSLAFFPSIYILQENQIELDFSHITPIPAHAKSLGAYITLFDKGIAKAGFSAAQSYLKINDKDGDTPHNYQAILDNLDDANAWGGYDRTSILLNGDIISINNNITGMLDAKEELKLALAALCEEPYSVLFEEKDQSSVFSGAGESYLRYKSKLKFLQDNDLYPIIAQILDFSNDISVKSWVFNDPLSLGAETKLDLIKKEFDLYLSAYSLMPLLEANKTPLDVLEDLKIKYEVQGEL